MADVPDADPTLVSLLRIAGEKWGAESVAELAAKLAEPEPEPAPPPPVRMTGGANLPVSERAWSPVKPDRYRFGFG
jgi:hypothetical protein